MFRRSIGIRDKTQDHLFSCGRTLMSNNIFGAYQPLISAHVVSRNSLFFDSKKSQDNKSFCTTDDSDLSDEQLKKLNHFIENAHQMSHKFVLKKFDEVNIGDIISSYHDFNLYLIYQKNIHQDIYTEENHKTKSKTENQDIDNIYIHDDEHLVGENIRNSLIFKSGMRFDSGGGLKLVEREKKRFSNQSIILGPSYLIMDTTACKFFHTNKVKVGDIILNKSDKKFYRLTEYHQNSLMDEQNFAYDCSYYDAIEIGGNLGNVSQEKPKIGIGSFVTQAQDHFVVLDKEYLKSTILI